MSEPILRLVFFIGTLTIMALWESIAPYRTLTLSKTKRWFGNLSLTVINTILLRSLFPLAAVGIADLCHQNSWGIFNQAVILDHIPLDSRLLESLILLLSILILDFLIYLQHVLFHRIPILWRIHRVHHADLDLDVTTGLRFHPLEILLSMIFKIGAVLLLGPPSTAVIAFEILLNSTALFNHSNINLPSTLDKGLRWILITPAMHRLHHSVIPAQTHRNFGFNLPWWDYGCKTYLAEPFQTQTEIQIGLADYPYEQVAELPWILTNPFSKTSPLPKE